MILKNGGLSNGYKKRHKNLTFYNLIGKLRNILYQIVDGSGGGAVNSVNGKTGDVILNPDDLDDTTSTNKFISPIQASNITSNTSARHTHSNKSILDATTASFLSAEKTKLNGIATGATANDTDANLKNRANHTGTQDATTISGTFTVNQLPTGTTATTVSLGNHSHGEASTTVAGFMSSADKTELNGIAANATANATDSSLRDRSTHTGTQPFTTISGTATTAQIPNLEASKINALTGYAIGTAGDVVATDTLLQAIAKLEARIVALETV